MSRRRDPRTARFDDQAPPGVRPEGSKALSLRDIRMAAPGRNVHWYFGTKVPFGMRGLVGAGVVGVDDLCFGHRATERTGEQVADAFLWPARASRDRG